MKFLITITLSFVLVLALGTSSNAQYNDEPCMPAQDQNGYAKFVMRHILPAGFDPNVEGAWQWHIWNIGRCHIPSQTFIRNMDKEKVEDICNGHGRTLAHQMNNLCISNNDILVYQVEVNTATCEIIHVMPRTQRIIVACDKVDNGCHPVHYERNNGQQPGNIICEP